MQTVQSCFSYLLIQCTECCLEIITGNTDNKLSLLFLGCSKAPIKSSGRSGCIKKKLHSQLTCIAGGCFQTSLVWIRLLVLMNGCLQELNGFSFFIWFVGGVFLVVGREQKTKHSSMTDPCVKWGISLTLPACSMFLKNMGQIRVRVC